MRSRAWFVAAVAVMAVQVFPMQETVSAQNGVVSTDIVISELRFSGPNGDNDEFIELFNLGDTAVEIGGWTVRVAGPTGTTNLQRAMIPTDNKSLVGPGCYYLLAFGGAGNYSLNNVAAPDHAYSVGFGDTGSIAILRTN